MSKQLVANRATSAANGGAARSGGRGRWRRPELVGGLAIGAVLTLLAVMSVPAQGRGSSIVAFADMARTARLFHRVLPTLLVLPVSPFAVLAWGSIAILWLVYLWLVWRLRAGPICLPLVAGAAVGFGLLAVTVPPLFSTDVFSYAIYGRLAGVYRVNPYLTTPARSAALDPLMPFVFWRNIPTPYGPLWTLLSAVVAGGRDALPIVLVLRFKLVALAATLLDGGLIYRFVRRSSAPRAGWAYLAFAWNPLVLVSGPVTGHNDVLILALVLTGACLVQTHPRCGVVCLTASALIKYSTVPLLGAAAVRFVRRTPDRLRAPRIRQAVACGLVLVIAVFLPFWQGAAPLLSPLGEPGRGVTNPVIRLATWLLDRLTLGHLAIASPRVAVGLALALFGAWQLGQWKREGASIAVWTVDDELASWSETVTAFLIVWPRDRTWYWLLPLGLALASGPRHRCLTLCVLLGSLLAYSYSIS